MSVTKLSIEGGGGTPFSARKKSVKIGLKVVFWERKTVVFAEQHSVFRPLRKMGGPHFLLTRVTVVFEPFSAYNLTKQISFKTKSLTRLKSFWCVTKHNTSHWS